MAKLTLRIMPRALIALLASLLLAPLAYAQQATPAAKPDPLAAHVVMQPKPGTVEAAKFAPSFSLRAPGLVTPAFRRADSGLYLPDRRIVIVNEKTSFEQARWMRQRHLVGRYLKAKGVSLSPEPYQNLLVGIRKRADTVLAQQNMSMADWKLVAVEGGLAKDVNAGAWSGGIITVNRPLIDLSYQLAQIVTSVGTQIEIDQQFRELARYRAKKGPMPAALAKPPAEGRNAVAESIVAGVVLHEMGHASGGHVALKDQTIWTPSTVDKRDLPKSRANETAADQFSVLFGARGRIAKAPGAIPLFDYYMFVTRPTFVEKKPNELDWRTHPLDADRYNASLAQLEGYGIKTGMESVGQKIITLDPKPPAADQVPKLWVPESVRQARAAQQQQQRPAPNP